MATSSEVNSCCDDKDGGENIKLRPLSKHRDTKTPQGEVNICSRQENEPDRLETSPFHPSKHNSLVHLRSSFFSKSLTNTNLSPMEHTQGTKLKAYHKEPSKSLDRPNSTTCHIGVQSPNPYFSRLSINDAKSSNFRSCQMDPICNAKLSRLTCELEYAKKQVEYLEDVLRMKDLEDEEDGSSTDADFVDLDQGTIIENIVFMFKIRSHSSKSEVYYASNYFFLHFRWWNNLQQN